MSKAEKKEELSGLGKQIHSAIWLIGLALIAWQHWWWPGMLVLVAISGIAEGLIMLYVNRTQEQKVLVETRTTALPKNCPNCGGPLDATKVKWTSANTAICPYCGTTLKIAGTNQAQLSQR